MSKVITIHGHTLELDMGPSCPNPGIRRQLDAKGEPYMCTSDLTTWLADEIMRKQPDYCFCGHIHSGNHELQEITGIHLANVSLVGEDYNIHYEPLYLNI